MTRNQLIDAIMLEVDQVPELDSKDREAVLWRLRLTHSAVLREIYSTNAVQLAISRAYGIVPSRSQLKASGSAARRASDRAVNQA